MHTRNIMTTPITLSTLTTAIVYDERMLEHEESDHPECPDRIKVIYEALNKKGLLDRSSSYSIIWIKL